MARIYLHGWVADFLWVRIYLSRPRVKCCSRISAPKLAPVAPTCSPKMCAVSARFRRRPRAWRVRADSDPDHQKRRALGEERPPLMGAGGRARPLSSCQGQRTTSARPMRLQGRISELWHRRPVGAHEHIPPGHAASHSAAILARAWGNSLFPHRRRLHVSVSAQPSLPSPIG